MKLVDLSITEFAKVLSDAPAQVVVLLLPYPLRMGFLQNGL